MFSDDEARSLLAVTVVGHGSDWVAVDYIAAGLVRDRLRVATERLDVALEVAAVDESAMRHRADALVVLVTRETLPAAFERLRAGRRLISRCGIVCVSQQPDVRLLGPAWDDRPSGTRFVAIPALASAHDLTDVVIQSVRAPFAEIGPIERRLPLTEGQMEVMALVAEGLTNEQIAVRRGISEKAVRNMIGRIARRVGLSDGDPTNIRVGLARRLLLGNADVVALLDDAS
jgi:DNA-binding CsgD family transcriptional regulator